MYTAKRKNGKMYDTKQQQNQGCKWRGEGINVSSVQPREANSHPNTCILLIDMTVFKDRHRSEIIYQALSHIEDYSWDIDNDQVVKLPSS